MNKLNSMTSVAALVALSMVGAATQVSAASTTTETHVTKTADAKCGEAKCGADKAKFYKTMEIMIGLHRAVHSSY